MSVCQKTDFRSKYYYFYYGYTAVVASKKFREKSVQLQDSYKTWLEMRLSRMKIELKLDYKGRRVEGKVFPLGDAPVPNAYRVELNGTMYGYLEYLPNGYWNYPPGDDELTDLIIEFIVAWYQ